MLNFPELILDETRLVNEVETRWGNDVAEDAYFFLIAFISSLEKENAEPAGISGLLSAGKLKGPVHHA